MGKVVIKIFFKAELFILIQTKSSKSWADNKGNRKQFYRLYQCPDFTSSLSNKCIEKWNCQFWSHLCYHIRSACKTRVCKQNFYCKLVHMICAAHLYIIVTKLHCFFKRCNLLCSWCKSIRNLMNG